MLFKKYVVFPDYEKARRLVISGNLVSHGNGTESRCASLPLYRDEFTSDDFHYAICYQVDGREYWANNFGADYGKNHHIFQ